MNKRTQVAKKRKLKPVALFARANSTFVPKSVNYKMSKPVAGNPVIKPGWID